MVNAFTVTEAGEITDYGDYESVHNLTSLEAIEEDKDEYTFYSEKGKFYYQGNMVDAQLPWNFEMKYVLDGKEVSTEELAGGGMYGGCGCKPADHIYCDAGSGSTECRQRTDGGAGGTIRRWNRPCLLCLWKASRYRKRKWWKR